MTDVLGKVRAALGDDPQHRRVAAAEWLNGEANRRRAARTSRPDLQHEFRARAEAASCQVESLAAVRDVPRALDAHLARCKIAPRLIVPPDPLLRSWLEGSTEFEVRLGRASPRDPTALALATSAVAETGTLVFHSGPSFPSALAFLPDHFIALVPHSRIVATYEDAFERVRPNAAVDALPRSVHFVTGPSRTADIEERILLGAHGPLTVLVLMIKDL